MPLTIEQRTWITGLSGASSTAPADTQYRKSVLNRLEGTSEIVTGHLTTYARFAAVVPTDPDWPFLVRVLRQCRMAADALTDQSDVDAFHLEPPSTGHAGWDAILAGVAEMTGTGRVSDPEVLAWCRNPDRFLPHEFDPLNTGKYRWLDYQRTPKALRKRNLVLAAGNLAGI